MSRAKRGRQGFTLVEMMVVCLIVCGVTGALFMALSAGDASFAVNAEKVTLQAKVRTVSDWIARDLRNAISWEINANSPSAVYVKFNLWDWDASAHTWALGTTYVEYAYDTSAHTLSRRRLDNLGSVLEETVFTEITAAPFYTSYVSESNNQFDSSALLSNRMLVVVIRSEHLVRGQRNLSYTLVSEVKIRNG